MNLLSMAGFAVIACLLALALKSYKPEYSMLISLAAVAVILGYILTQAMPLFNYLNGLFGQAHIAPQYPAILLKSLGLCFVSQFAGDICRDAGYSTIASKIELSGKIAVLLLAMPLFSGLVEVVLKLLGVNP
ncbi:MAG: stage III sporulation protein AD [Oscillospiraceae bacterium]|jgi:stage III sporulation protein AD|nr:stage III sporulation protein AD [Oscillospiraceae bacterium]